MEQRTGACHGALPTVVPRESFSRGIRSAVLIYTVAGALTAFALLSRRGGRA